MYYFLVDVLLGPGTLPLNRMCVLCNKLIITMNMQQYILFWSWFSDSKFIYWSLEQFQGTRICSFTYHHLFDKGHSAYFWKFMEFGSNVVWLSVVIVEYRVEFYTIWFDGFTY
jgi:hypothetical protein